MHVIVCICISKKSEKLFVTLFCRGQKIELIVLSQFSTQKLVL